MSLFRTLVVYLAAACAIPSVQAAEITGAGSTFAAPMYAQWADAYQKVSGVKVNYQGVGSSAGAQYMKAKTVDFAASDTPFSDQALAQAGLFQFATIAGGVVPVVHLPGIRPGELILSGSVLGDIYLGKIKKWNAPEIVQLNPELQRRNKLPNLDIAVVRRADGAGTSSIWTHYLSNVNAQWKRQVGEGATVRWPTGIGGKGNDGVAAFVARLTGAIGYVEWAYAKQNKMSYVRLRHASGSVVAPNPQTFKAALETVDWTKTLRMNLTTISAKNAWPIMGVTFALLRVAQPMSPQTAQALKFFDWSFKHGAQTAVDLDYIMLPAAAIDQIRTRWRIRFKD